MSDIILSHLCKSYGDHPVLNDFSAILPEGRTTCVMAPSGGGKTTLLRLLLGLEPPDSGVISGLSGIKKSAVFQEDRLCENLNPVSNICLVNPALSTDQVVAEMAVLGLTGCAGQPVRELSGGMKRRVAILRALLAEYDVLFLDEPFKGLDQTMKLQTIHYVREHCKGHTVVLVTHDRAEAEEMRAAQILTLPGAGS